MPKARVVNSATSALHAALEAAGVRGREVIVPAYTMSASASAIIHAGGIPRFADIGDDYCLDWEDVRGRVDSSTAAIVLVHLFGHHASVPSWVKIPVIHDASQSPSLRPNARRAEFGDIWCYSLNQWKIVTSGEGGYALTFSSRLADRLHAVRNHGECYTKDILGWNYRMTEPVARLGRNEFRQLDQRLAERGAWADDLSRAYGISDPGNKDWFLYPVRIPSGERELFARRVGGRCGYHKPLYRLPYFASHGYDEAWFPNVERIENELVVINPLEAQP